MKKLDKDILLHGIMKSLKFVSDLSNPLWFKILDLGMYAMYS